MKLEEILGKADRIERYLPADLIKEEEYNVQNVATALPLSTTCPYSPPTISTSYIDTSTVITVQRVWLVLLERRELLLCTIVPLYGWYGRAVFNAIHHSNVTSHYFLVGQQFPSVGRLTQLDEPITDKRPLTVRVSNYRNQMRIKIVYAKNLFSPDSKSNLSF